MINFDVINLKTMEIKHTNGEWKKELLLANYSVTSEDKLIAKVYSQSYMNDDEAEANAKLIASAPDLLEALIQVAEDVSFEDKTITQSTINRVLNAIKKATE